MEDISMRGRTVTSDEIGAVLGVLGDAALAAIVATGATLHDVEVAGQWLAGADDVMGKQREPLSGLAAAIVDIIEVDEIATPPLSASPDRTMAGCQAAARGTLRELVVFMKPQSRSSDTRLNIKSS
jgi:hypothetical protein